MSDQILFFAAFVGKTKPSTSAAASTGDDDHTAKLSINEHVQDSIVSNGDDQSNTEVQIVAKKEVTCAILPSIE